MTGSTASDAEAEVDQKTEEKMTASFNEPGKTAELHKC